MSRILIVDDEAQFRELLSTRLKKRGFDTVLAEDGEKAIKIARMNLDVDIAILDLNMPKMDGIQTFKEIKEFRPAMQAIILTGYGSLESATQAGRLNIFKYLQKPCDIDELIKAIDAAKEEVVFARERHEIPQRIKSRSIFPWLMGSHNSRPLFIILGFFLFAALLHAGGFRV